MGVENRNQEHRSHDEEMASIRAAKKQLRHSMTKLLGDLSKESLQHQCKVANDI